MSEDQPDFTIIVRDNEAAAASAIAEGRYIDAFLLMHALIEALLRAFLRADEPVITFDALVLKYEAFLRSENYPFPEFVDELRQFNRRRNRVVHGLWRTGYSYTNRQTKEAVDAAQIVYGLFVEWLETFDPEITKVGFHYDH